MSYESLLTQLKQARQAKGLKQELLADALGVTQGMFSKYEQGISPVAAPDLLKWGQLVGLEVKLDQIQEAA